MVCGLPSSSIPGIFQARVLEWVAIAFSRWSSQPSDWTWVSRIVGRLFTVWATREVHIKHRNSGSCKQLNIFIVYSDLKSVKRQDRKNKRLNPDFRILCIQCARPTGLVELSQINQESLRMTQRDGMGREVGGGFRIGNTCTPVVDSCWCMAKPIQYCKVISLQLK